MFPNNSSLSRRLASLPRLLQGEVRRSLRYYQGALTSRCPFRLASFPSLGNTMYARDVPTFNVSSRARVRPEFFTDSSRCFTWKQRDLPSSRESSIVRLLLFFDPGRIDLSRPSRRIDVAPARRTTKAPTINGISGLISNAFGLPVYASQ